jgi:hypothetical protein
MLNNARRNTAILRPHIPNKVLAVAASVVIAGTGMTTAQAAIDEPADASTCPTNTLCVYQGIDFTGTQSQFRAEGVSLNLRTQGTKPLSLPWGSVQDNIQKAMVVFIGDEYYCLTPNSQNANPAARRLTSYVDIIGSTTSSCVGFGSLGSQTRIREYG